MLEEQLHKYIKNPTDMEATLRTIREDIFHHSGCCFDFELTYQPFFANRKLPVDGMLQESIQQRIWILVVVFNPHFLCYERTINEFKAGSLKLKSFMTHCAPLQGISLWDTRFYIFEHFRLVGCMNDKALLRNEIYLVINWLRRIHSNPKDAESFFAIWTFMLTWVDAPMVNNDDESTGYKMLIRPLIKWMYNNVNHPSSVIWYVWVVDLLCKEDSMSTSASHSALSSITPTITSVEKVPLFVTGMEELIKNTKGFWYEIFIITTDNQERNINLMQRIAQTAVFQNSFSNPPNARIKQRYIKWFLNNIQKLENPSCFFSSILKCILAAEDKKYWNRREIIDGLVLKVSGFGFLSSPDLLLLVLNHSDQSVDHVVYFAQVWLGAVISDTDDAIIRKLESDDILVDNVVRVLGISQLFSKLSIAGKDRDSYFRLLRIFDRSKAFHERLAAYINEGDLSTKYKWICGILAANLKDDEGTLPKDDQEEFDASLLLQACEDVETLETIYRLFVAVLGLNKARWKAVSHQVCARSDCSDIAIALVRIVVETWEADLFCLELVQSCGELLCKSGKDDHPVVIILSLALTKQVSNKEWENADIEAIHETFKKIKDYLRWTKRLDLLSIGIFLGGLKVKTSCTYKRESSFTEIPSDDKEGIDTGESLNSKIPRISGNDIDTSENYYSIIPRTSGDDIDKRESSFTEILEGTKKRRRGTLTEKQKEKKLVIIPGYDNLNPSQMRHNAGVPFVYSMDNQSCTESSLVNSPDVMEPLLSEIVKRRSQGGYVAKNAIFKAKYMHVVNFMRTITEYLNHNLPEIEAFRTQKSVGSAEEIMKSLSHDQLTSTTFMDELKRQYIDSFESRCKNAKLHADLIKLVSDMTRMNEDQSWK